MNSHFDVIIIGTGTGGGTLAYRLAPPTDVALSHSGQLYLRVAALSEIAVFRIG